jgi:hypothetical protein
MSAKLPLLVHRWLYHDPPVDLGERTTVSNSFKPSQADTDAKKKGCQLRSRERGDGRCDLGDGWRAYRGVGDGGFDCGNGFNVRRKSPCRFQIAWPDH